MRHAGRHSAADEGRPRESKGRGPGRAVGVGGDDRDEPVVDQLPGGLACVIAVIAGFLAGAYVHQAVAEQY